MKIGIVGQGYVGTAVRTVFEKHYDVLTYDLDRKLSNCQTLYELVNVTDVVFVCVPTPMNKDRSCNTDIVEDVTPQLGGNLDIQAFNIEGAVAADFVKLNAITSSAAELNVLDGIPGTLTFTELGYVDGVTSAIQTQINTKLANISEDTTPELGGELDCGAHSIGFTQQSTTGDGTTTIDWKLGNKFKHTFGAQNETFTFTAPSNPCNILLMLIQDGGGSRTVTWPGTVKWPSATAPTLSTGSGDIDIVSFYYDGTNYYGNSSLDFG